MKQALILFAHGARDPRWAEPFERLQQLVQDQRPQVTVRLAFLELMAPRLPELAAELAGQGCNEIAIVPIFLGQGGHMRRDLPLLVEELRAAHPAVSFSVAGAAGEDAAVLEALARYCVQAVPLP